MKRRIAVAGMVLVLLGIVVELYFAQAMFRADIAAVFAMGANPDEHVPPKGEMDLRCSAVLARNEPGRIRINLSNHSGENLPVHASLYIKGTAYTVTPIALSIDEMIPSNQSVEREWNITSTQADDLTVSVLVMEHQSYYWLPRSCGIVVRELAGIPGKVVQRLSTVSVFLEAILLTPWLVEAWRESKGKRLRRATLGALIIALGAGLLFSVILANAFRI